MKTNLYEIGKAYLGSSLFFSIAGEGVLYLADSYQLIREPNYLLPAVVGFSVPAVPFAFYLAARVAHLARPPQSTANRPAYTSLGHAAAWIMPQPKAPPGGWAFGRKGRLIKYKADPPKEFIFWEKGMDSMISEFVLFSFCKAAWRRQQQVLYGSLGANKIFSREYFTQEARPRFPLPDYKSILYILMSRNLVLNRWGGKGGQLRYPPYSTIEEAKDRWGHLQESSS